IMFIVSVALVGRTPSAMRSVSLRPKTGDRSIHSNISSVAGLCEGEPTDSIMTWPGHRARAGENAALSSQGSNRSCLEIPRAEAAKRRSATLAGAPGVFHRPARHGDHIEDIGNQSPAGV